VPITGRFDLAGAVAAVSPAFATPAASRTLTGIAVFTPLIDKPEVRDFVPPTRRIMG
jgi:hypothetical protein